MADRRRVYTPTVLQLEAVECGAAALGIMLGYHGRFVPLAELRRECGVSRDGSKASKVVQAARRYGLIAKGYSRQLESLRELALPYIIYWQFNHYLVVEGYGDGFYYVNDPASGHRTISQEEFNNGFTGVVLTMEPGPEFTRGGQKSRLFPAAAKRLRGSLSTVLFCLFAGALLALPGLVVPVYTRVFIDDVLLAGHVDWLRPLLALMAATLVIQVGLKWLEVTYLRRLMVALTTRLASGFFWHLLRLPLSFYAQRYAGEVSYRIELNQKVADFLSGRLARTVIALVTMVLYATAMMFYSVRLTALALLFAAVNFWAIRRLYRRRAEASLRAAQDTGKAAGVAIAGLQGIETLKASGMEDGFFAKWAGYYGKAEMARQEVELPALTLGSLPPLLEGLAISVVLIAGGMMVIGGEITLGMLVAFQALTHSFLDPVSELVRLSGTIHDLETDLLRLDDVLDNAAGPLPPFARTEGAVRLEGTVEACGLTFGYSPTDPPLIREFQLRVRPGQWVALVGSSGSGKSTMAKLLTGLYEPWAGEVRFDGRPRPQIDRGLLSHSLAFVDQDVMLFEGSVRDNLSLWDRTVSTTTLTRACQDAAIDADLGTLAGGYEAVLQEGGANFSGGQRQRLEIARALVNNPSVLVLDEATSALDAETEMKILENLRRRGCTCIVIAHRLSTIRDCDEIVVLDDGEVVERGTHEELWAAQGPYARLLQAGDED